MKAWTIKQWNDVFEDFRSRAVARLRFLPFDLSRNSEAYTVLVSSEAGIAAYGVFWALVLVAARCPKRGVLADEKGPISTRRLAARTRMSEASLTAGIALLSHAEVGWLYEIDWQGIDGASMEREISSTAHRRRIDGASTNGPTNIDESEKNIDGASMGASRAQNTNRTVQDKTKQKSYRDTALTRSEMRTDLDAAIDRIPNHFLEEALKHYPRWPWDPASAYDAASDAVNFIAARSNWTWQQALAWLGDRIKAYADAKKGGTHIQSPVKWLTAHAFDNNPESWKENGSGRDHAGGRAGGGDRNPSGTQGASSDSENRRSEKARREFAEPKGTGGVRVA